MKVLVIGAGGREHALAYTLARSPRVSEVLVAPGNAGTARESGCRNVAVAADDIPGLLRLAQAEAVGLTVVGPELPLSLGVVDSFEAAGLRIFGPTRAAAQLEASKAFTKDFLERHRIPTAQYRVFTEPDGACAYVRQRGAPIVVKADGLAAGKGVVVAMTLDEAETAIRDMLSGEMLGKAGARVVIEDFLEGEEASFIVVAGRNGDYAVMASAQDHKRVGDGDCGPNTGGMGAYSPAPVVTAAVHARACREVIEPTLAGMAAEGAPFGGFLYAGLMIDKSGAPHVIEFNVRMGDPETQPILMRLESDLVELLEASLDNSLSQHPPRWSADATLGVVMAAEGYPGPIAKGDAIHGLDADFGAQAKVFHAGTADQDGAVVSTGGRVLCVVGKGADLRTAQAAAYAAVDKIHWRGEFHRRDIGWRAFDRKP
ncbi:MAG: phosphoribosylamine--glycine ligase [Stagnimonas sp.]|nr:phosphoribosylamine--glycine ligase [Stagnimonas sp.]